MSLCIPSPPYDLRWLWGVVRGRGWGSGAWSGIRDGDQSPGIVRSVAVLLAFWLVSALHQFSDCIFSSILREADSAPEQVGRHTEEAAEAAAAAGQRSDRIDCSINPRVLRDRGGESVATVRPTTEPPRTSATNRPCPTPTPRLRRPVTDLRCRSQRKLSSPI